jgi:adenine C2-methylase RlmN of 23S rRNA A2503 and tRNA A37
MSVEDRIDELEEEMAEFYGNLYGRKFEVKTVHEWLAEGGYVAPEAPADVASELRTLLDHLANIGVVVEFADHLSDRELYLWLIEQLGAHMALMPNNFLHMSPIGGCSEEDDQNYLTYYATDADRADRKARFPDEELPPKKELPYKRDL